MTYRRDPLIEALAALPAVQPDAARADAVRTRCRSMLETEDEGGFNALEPAVGVACAAYAVQLARLALRLSQ